MILIRNYYNSSMILIECLIICIGLVIIIEYIKKVFVNQFYQQLKFYFPMQFLFL